LSKKPRHPNSRGIQIAAVIRITEAIRTTEATQATAGLIQTIVDLIQATVDPDQLDDQHV
jgi:hypothetical protein